MKEEVKKEIKEEIKEEVDIKKVIDFDFYKPVKCTCGKKFKLGIKVGKIHDGSCPYCGREYEIVGGEQNIILRPKIKEEKGEIRGKEKSERSR